MGRGSAFVFLKGTKVHAMNKVINLDLRDMALFKRCLMCPDCYSTTEPDEEIAENFLSEANPYNAQGQRPHSNDPIWSDLDQIKQCIEDLYNWIDGMYPGVVNLKKAAQETLLFPSAGSSCR
jgi:hypothetical protein